jgi:peptide/nickel transport system substrate-binding protein
MIARLPPGLDCYVNKNTFVIPNGVLFYCYSPPNLYSGASDLLIIFRREKPMGQENFNRREFLKSAGALSLSASVLGVPAPARAAAKKGGRLRLGLTGGSSSDSLDPGTWADAFMMVGMFGVYNRLTEVRADGAIIPELAESWEASDDARVWRFRLRRGVAFHNGKTFGADDVVASVNHHRGEKSTSAAKALLSQIAAVRADGKNTVVFELESGNADFPYILNDVHLVMLPAKDGAADWRSAIGTGGYTLAAGDLDPGVRMFLRRQSGYWKEGRAHFDEVEIIGISDATARTSALTTGTVDAIDEVDLKTAERLAGRGGVVVEEKTGNRHYTLPMHTDAAPFSDNNVRLALKYAIDREAVLRTVLRGRGRIGNDHPIGPANRYFHAGLAQREYDPERAKFHLKQAGLSSLKVNLSAAEAAFTGALDTAVLFKEHAAKAGIEINVAREADDGYWSNVWLKKPFVTCFWSGRPTEDQMFSIAYSADAKWNDTHFQHARFNQLLKQARSELDDAKRRGLYHEMQEIVSNEGGVIVPLYANWVFARTTAIAHDGNLAANRELDGRMIVERWWRA